MGKMIKNGERQLAMRLMQQKAAVNPYIWRDFEKFPTAWVARDYDNSLWLYSKEPDELDGMFFAPAGGDYIMQLPEDCYPDLTSELSPIKVRLLLFAE